jgi:glycosyltransferase involved in cell wall biosynthesis
MTPFVSVVIPCRNEARFIDRCLRSILSNDYVGGFEVIVADGMSTDGTREKLAQYQNVRVIDNPDRLTPIALNRAIAASHGEIIVRFDAHAVMPPDYIRRLVNLLISSNADNAGGSIRTVPRSGDFFAEPIAAVLSSRFGVGNSSFRTRSGQQGARSADTVFGGCWRRELFSRIGGFNEQLARGQDMEFNLRIQRSGGTILLDPSIVCDYFAPSTLGAFVRHSFSNGVWAILPFAFTDAIPVRLRHLIPLAFVAGLAISCFLPFPWSIGIGCLYVLVNFTFSMRAHRKAWLMPLVFATLHFCYGLGSAWGLLQLASRKLSNLKGSPKHASRLET